MSGTLSTILRGRAPDGYIMLSDWCKQHKQPYHKYSHRINHMRSSMYKRIAGHLYVPIDMPVDNRNYRLSPFRGKVNLAL